MALADEFQDLDQTLSAPDRYHDAESGDWVEVEAAEPLDITDVDTANRYGRRLTRLARQVDEAKEVTKAETDRIKDWRDGRLYTLAAKAEWIKAGLESYMRALNREAPDRVTLDLPNVTLRLRKAKAVYSVTDMDALRAAMPGLVELVPKLRESGLNLAAGPAVEGSDPDDGRFVAVDADGTIVPGVEVLLNPVRRFTAQAKA